MSVSTRLLTYDDLIQTPDDGKRYELIRGEIVVSPAPSWKHQRVSLELTMRFGSFVKAHQLGRVYVAPTDVKLSAHDVVQPDLFFIRRDRIPTDDATGASAVILDLVVEILSPSTRARDLTTKQRFYEQFGVPEYWQVDPDVGTIAVFVLRGGRYERLPQEGGIVRSTVLSGLTIDVAALFEDARWAGS